MDADDVNSLSEAKRLVIQLRVHIEELELEAERLHGVVAEPREELKAERAAPPPSGGLQL